MTEKRFRRRVTKADRSAQVANGSTDTLDGSSETMNTSTDTLDGSSETMNTSTDTLDGSTGAVNGSTGAQEAEPQPNEARPRRRTPVLRATPTAMPTTPSSRQPERPPVTEPPPTTGPAGNIPTPADEPTVEAAVTDPSVTAPPEARSSTTEPTATEPPATEPSAAEAQAPEPSAREDRPGAEDKVDGSGPAWVAVPQQRKVEREPSGSEVPPPPATRPAPKYVHEQEAPRYLHEKEADRGTTDSRRPAAGADEGSAGGGRKPLTVSLNWRTVGAALLAVAVVFWLGRGFFGGGPTGQESTPSTNKEQKAVTVPKAKKPPKRVVINGSTIRAAGAVITINPALAQPGASMTVTGAGFDGGSTVDILLSSKGQQTGTGLGFFKTDRSGGLNAQVTLPDNIEGSSVIVTAKQQNSDNIATAEAVTAAGMGFAKLSKATGKPGDTVSVSARGFLPNEKIKVYWGRASGTPTSTIQADQSGAVGKAPIQVGVGQVGEATLVLVGAQSGTTATVPFYMLGLYPTAEATPYALKSGEPLSLSASGFAPEERVLIYVNTSSGPPAMTAKSDTQGNVGGLSFNVPFGLRGSQSLVMVGEKSRASVSSGFQVLPYTPSAQTSTYGGSPGTSFSFFAKAFAPNEVVLVYLGRTKWDAGELVSAFRVNDRGEAGAAGEFQITTQDQGTLNFTLIGQKSQGKASTSLKVTPATGTVENLPEREPYERPKSLGGK